MLPENEKNVPARTLFLVRARVGTLQSVFNGEGIGAERRVSLKANFEKYAVPRPSCKFFLNFFRFF